MGETPLSPGLRSPISLLLLLLVLFCMWGLLPKCLSVFFFSFIFLPIQHVSPLSLFVSCSHTFFWPQKEIKGSLSQAVWFSLQAAEREAEDITGYMGPCGGALMTELDAIPCYVNTFDYVDYTHMHRYADGKHKQECTHVAWTESFF